MFLVCLLMRTRRGVSLVQAKEKDNVFGQGTRSPVAIILLVKNPNAAAVRQIYFYALSDYLRKQEKLTDIARLGSIGGITREDGWRLIEPNEHGDWIRQRNASFGDFLSIGNKSFQTATLFENFSLGVVTNRDAWCYNGSRIAVGQNVARLISSYNAELDRFNAAYPPGNRNARKAVVDNFITYDKKRISWTRSLKAQLVANKRHIADDFENCS